MNFEIVTLAEKTIVGVSARTSNNDPKMGEIIGGLWQTFYRSGISNSIRNRINEYAIGLYSDYEGDSYQVTVGHEVSEAANADNEINKIPAGNYAVFSVEGDMVKAVADAWQEIWNMDLERSYTGDFEEYLNNDMENARVRIYIALKE